MVGDEISVVLLRIVDAGEDEAAVNTDHRGFHGLTVDLGGEHITHLPGLHLRSRLAANSNDTGSARLGRALSK